MSSIPIDDKHETETIMNYRRICLTNLTYFQTYAAKTKYMTCPMYVIKFVAPTYGNYTGIVIIRCTGIVIIRCQGIGLQVLSNGKPKLLTLFFCVNVSSEDVVKQPSSKYSIINSTSSIQFLILVPKIVNLLYK